MRMVKSPINISEHIGHLVELRSMLGYHIGKKFKQLISLQIAVDDRLQWVYQAASRLVDKFLWKSGLKSMPEDLI